MAPSLESRFTRLELSKAELEERLAKTGQTVKPFEEALEHAMRFLSNPWELWKNGTFELRRTILKMVLTTPIHYHRETGVRTPKLSFPFKVLMANCTQEFEMVRAVGLEPTRAQGPTDFKSGMSTIPSRPHPGVVAIGCDHVWAMHFLSRLQEPKR